MVRAGSAVLNKKKRRRVPLPLDKTDYRLRREHRARALSVVYIFGILLKNEMTNMRYLTQLYILVRTYTSRGSQDLGNPFDLSWPSGLF